MQNAALAMDRMYRHQRHIYDLTRKPYLLGRDHLIEGLAPPPQGAVLEIGCGTARNLIQAAHRYKSVQFYGVDVSAMMLEQAQKSLAHSSVKDRVHLKQGDAAHFDAQALFGRAQFDRIFISYALSMIPPWRETLLKSLELLAPNSSLHIVDFGDQDRLPRWFQRGLILWLKAFDVTPRAELQGELERTTRARGLLLSSEPLYRGYAFHAVARA